MPTTVGPTDCATRTAGVSLAGDNVIAAEAADSPLLIDLELAAVVCIDLFSSPSIGLPAMSLQPATVAPIIIISAAKYAFLFFKLIHLNVNF